MRHVIIYGRYYIILMLMLLGMTLNEVPAQVRINEIMADNLNTLADPDKGNYGDWIELYNTGSTSVSLSGYFLSDNLENPGKWVFPEGSRIPGNGFLLIWADNDDAGYHTNFRLSKGGEIVILSDPGLVILDSITFIEQIEDVSYGRLNDGGSEWAYFSKPSPGTSNSSGSTELVAAPPAFSMSSGFYDGKQTLELKAQSADANIYYSLDGSVPTQSSTKFQNPINLNSTGVVRAIQLQVGYLPSPVITKTYFIDETTTLPVFSIVTDPDNLWDENAGIYVEGANYVWGWGNGNFWQDWEKPCYVEFWEDNRKQKIAQAAGLRITGALTRTASQKSLRIIARSDYGKTKFSYRFFKDKDISSFNDIVLRSSGNDWGFTMIADGLMATIVSGQLDIDYNAYRPSVLFLNGVYWGIHNIREKIGDDYVEENHGVDKDNIDLLAQVDDVREGDRIAYAELLSFVLSNDMTKESSYDYVESRIDIQEYCNYYVTQIFYANHDWPSGNIKYWRPRTEDGKWRWILYDTDLAYRQFWRDTFDWAINGNPDYPGSTTLFKALIANERFETLFLNTYQYQMATTFAPERLISIIDSLQEMIRPEIGRHIQKWYGQHSWTFTNAIGDYVENPWLENMQAWERNIDMFRSYALVRPQYINGFVSDYFGFGKPVNVVLETSPRGSGKIWVNNKRAVVGSSEFVFFENQPTKLDPISNLNTVFQDWTLIENYYQVDDHVNIILRKSVWKYLDTGVYPASDWAGLQFDDSAWPEGCAPLAYNYKDACTVIGYGDDSNNKHMSYLFRYTFEIDSSNDWSELTISILRDDGAVVYMNGNEIIRSNMPQSSNFNTAAVRGVDGDFEFEYFDYKVDPLFLRQGENILAVEVHQISKSSSDLSFDLGLVGIRKASSGLSSTISDEQLTRQFSGRVKLIANFGERVTPISVKINEVMASNSGSYLAKYGKTPDWIEIYNPNDQAVDMGGLYITDNLTVPDKWKIPETDPLVTVIPAKEFKLFFADKEIVGDPSYVDFQLSSEGEEIGIYEKTESGFRLIDSLFYPLLNPNTSFGRYPDGEDAWTTFLMSSTPGSSNKTLEDELPDVPVYLFASFPNPFMYSTTIRFYLREEAPVKLYIRDIQGKIVKVLADGQYDAGLQVIEWDGKDDQNLAVPPGMYFYTIYSTFYSDTYRTIRLR